MSERVHTSSERIPAFRAHETDELTDDEKKFVKKEEKRAKGRARAVLTLTSLALASTAGVIGYWADVSHNREVQAAADAQISLKVIAGPQNKENSDKAIILMDGYGTVDSDLLAKSIGPGSRQLGDGYLLSFDYNNGVISRDAVLKEVLRETAEIGVTHVTYVGHSTGGIMGLEAAADTVKYSYLNVDADVQLSAPSGPKGLNPQQAASLGFSQSVAKIPGATDSSAYLFGNEMLMRSGNYTKGQFKDFWSGESFWEDLGNVGHDVGIVANNIGAFFSTSGEVLSQLNNPDNISYRLLAQQGFKVQQFDAEAELKTINEQRATKQMFPIIYLKTNDTSVVNDEESALDEAKAAQKERIKFISKLVPDADHQLFFRYGDQYAHTFKGLSDPVKEIIRAEVKRHEMAMHIAQQKEQQTQDALSVNNRQNITPTQE